MQKPTSQEKIFMSINADQRARLEAWKAQNADNADFQELMESARIAYEAMKKFAGRQ
jgi:hypothetical protein